jgi:GNAT superfamily N-acetyltransferase
VVRHLESDVSPPPPLRLPTVTIRPATPADAGRITEFNLLLAMESESIALDPERLARGVRLGLETTGRGRYWVAEEDGRVRGQCMVTTEWSDWRSGWIWWLQSVYVEPGWRGRGLFSALWDRVLEDAHAEGDVVTLRLYVHRENRLARAVYERAGMEESPYLVYEFPLAEGPA